MAQQAWLCLEKSESQFVAAREGYGDVLGHSYSWDDRVPNSRQLAVGDYILLWNAETSLGLSVIEAITTSTRVRLVRRCPYCKSTDVRRRKRSAPEFRCGPCAQEFEIPDSESVTVETFTADYEAAWTPFTDWNAMRCRELALSPKSQHSLRPVEVGRLEALMNSTLAVERSRALRSRGTPLGGGHRMALTRVRRQQGKFRDELLRQFSSRCAFTGPAPSAALEAAHLYSYAHLGQHHADGGLVMRADIHNLFDLGLIAVNPTSLEVDLAPQLRHFDGYRALHGGSLQVKLSDGHRRWLRLHWLQHRDPMRT